MGLQPPYIRTLAQDGPGTDAFSRSRVSEPFPVWDNKNLSTKNEWGWEEVTSGGTETITHQIAKAAVELTVGTASGEYAIRQTHRYFPYVPGKSQLVACTGTFAAGQVGLTQIIGYCDSNDGPFFEMAGTEIGVVIRSSTSGSPVDERVAQSSWNLDKMDGTGPSGKTLDPTKSQIFIIDFQWLGVGRVRFGFDVDGEIFYVHEFNHSNLTSGVYMRTPTLPIRYEIRNTGTTSGATLTEICSSVSSEGGYTLPGVELSVSTGSINARKAVTTEVPILIVRLANSFNGRDNRRIVRFLSANFSAASNGARFRVAHIHSYSAVDAHWLIEDGVASPTPGAVTGDSAVEYAHQNAAQTGLPTITADHLHFLRPVFVGVGQGGRGSSFDVGGEFINAHSFISQNFDSSASQMFAIYAEGEPSSNVWASVDLIEFE